MKQNHSKKIDVSEKIGFRFLKHLLYSIAIQVDRFD